MNILMQEQHQLDGQEEQNQDVVADTASRELERMFFSAMRTMIAAAYCNSTVVDDAVSRTLKPPQSDEAHPQRWYLSMRLTRASRTFAGPPT